MEVLRLENLSKFYTTDNSVVVGLSGVSLSFSTGEFVALTGESGSGKSTLAHVLGGILPYESGELYVYGQPTSHFDAYDWSRYRRDLISFISQSYGILPGNTVTENVESALRLSGLSHEEARSRACDILDEVELTEFKKRKAGKLSSGQKQRLSIARALAKPSKILIADEPTGNLDRENSEKIISLLKKASQDRLVILITHEFEEAKDAATRRIILSDGAVVTDAKLSDYQEPMDQGAERTEAKKKKPLSMYVCRLTLRSRPVFTTVLVLLLAVTFFISFVFVGNFIIALDDTSTRIYDGKAFFNGTPERIVLMRSDGGSLTDEDYRLIAAHDNVDGVERFGYVNDIVYHYKVDEDHKTMQRIVLGPNYSEYPEMGDPNDYTIETVVEFIEENYKYVRTVPYTIDDIITEGRAPESAYEVLSADPDHKVGDTVRVYIRDIENWSLGSNLRLDLKVVGKTEHGKGLYFSDQLAAALIYPQAICETYPPYRPRNNIYVFAPYDSTVFSVKDNSSDFELSDSQFLYPPRVNTVLPVHFTLPTCDGDRVLLAHAGDHDSTYSGLILVSNDIFDRITRLDCDQVSVYIKDYSYADRVLSALTNDGYIALSPYKLGATSTDPTLANERMITLAICAAAFIIAFVLQCILLRTMFASLFEYYRLMSNTGLTANILYKAVTMMLVFTAFLGEVLGAGVIYLLDRASVERIVDIFKYLDIYTIILLFALHFLTVVLSLTGILFNLKKAVFGKGKSSYDIDFTLMEEEA